MLSVRFDLLDGLESTFLEETVSRKSLNCSRSASISALVIAMSVGGLYGGDFNGASIVCVLSVFDLFSNVSLTEESEFLVLFVVSSGGE